jgi:hypothetical protein
MKKCNKCGETYSDNSLRFCTQDGTALVVSPDQADTLVLYHANLEPKMETVFERSFAALYDREIEMSYDVPPFRTSTSYPYSFKTRGESSCEFTGKLSISSTDPGLHLVIHVSVDDEIVHTIRQIWSSDFLMEFEIDYLKAGRHQIQFNSRFEVVSDDNPSTSAYADECWKLFSLKVVADFNSVVHISSGVKTQPDTEISPESNRALREPTLLTCRGRNVIATGFVSSPTGFLVKEGSQAVLSEAPGLSDYGNNIHKTRAMLVYRGALASDGTVYLFTSDCIFNSPSLAAGVVLGHNCNGRVDWKDATGRTLKDIQEAEANN